MRLVPVSCQILPSRIHTLDQRHPSCPIPTFDFLLAIDRVSHIPKRLVVHKSMNAIPLREPLNLAALVLCHPSQ